MKVNLDKVPNMDMENINGQISPFTKVNGKMMSSMAMENISGLVVESLLDPGNEIKCMATENYFMRMDESTKVILKMTLNMEKATSPGQPARNTTVSG